MIRHAWLQKHPSPGAAGGEFHWYPADGDRELRSSFVERSRGIDAPAVLWELAPGRASWAQVFAATAPDDHRRYHGLALTIVEREGASAGELLAQIELPHAAPWSEANDDPRPRAGRDVPHVRTEPTEHVAAIARALLSDGTAIVPEPYLETLPGVIASIEHLMPAAAQARVRRGVWRASGAGHAPDRVTELVVEAWRDPASRAARAWTLLCELAASTERGVDDVAAELGSAESADAALTEGERAALGGARDFAMTLHAWGRGRLDRSPTAATLAERLADALALRVLAKLIAGSEPDPVVAEARRHALLPADRRTLLLETCARRGPSLRALVGGSHA